jgi:hypothetical protein
MGKRSSGKSLTYVLIYIYMHTCIFLDADGELVKQILLTHQLIMHAVPRMDCQCIWTREPLSRSIAAVRTVGVVYFLQTLSYFQAYDNCQCRPMHALRHLLFVW